MTEPRGENIAEVGLATITCAGTGEERQVRRLKSGEPAMPAGWKRLGEHTFGPIAWQERYVLRSIRVPIAGVQLPVNSPEENRRAWSELRGALQISWRQATQVSNWMITELAKADSAPLIESAAGPRLPKMAPLNPLLRRLYHECRARWPELDSQSLSSLRQRVVSKYLACRFELRCRASMSLPNFRYPTPLPIPAKDAKFFVSDESLCVQVRISGERFALRLRGGREFQRSSRVLRQVIEGELLSGELMLFEQTVGGAHRPGGRNDLTGRPTRLMLAVAVWVPKQARVEGRRTCTVKTGPERLWTVYLEGNAESWNLNEDQIRRWNAAYRQQLQRLREDAKLDRKNRGRNSLRRRRTELRNKYQNRIQDAIHKAAAMLASFCRRNTVAYVIYDDQDKRWLEEFPWHDLRRLCKEKCEAAGITLRSEEAGSDLSHRSGAEALDDRENNAATSDSVATDASADSKTEVKSAAPKTSSKRGDRASTKTNKATPKPKGKRAPPRA